MKKTPQTKKRGEQEKDRDRTLTQKQIMELTIFDFLAICKTHNIKLTAEPLPEVQKRKRQS